MRAAFGRPLLFALRPGGPGPFLFWRGGQEQARQAGLNRAACIQAAVRPAPFSQGAGLSRPPAGLSFPRPRRAAARRPLRPARPVVESLWSAALPLTRAREGGNVSPCR